MKIENDKLNILPGAADPLGAVAPAGPASGLGKSGAAAQSDQVTLSPEARLLQAATDAAAGQPGVRADLVERMRALLNEGAVGADAERLADAIIDDVLNNRK